MRISNIYDIYLYMNDNKFHILYHIGGSLMEPKVKKLVMLEHGNQSNLVMPECGNRSHS